MITFKSDKERKEHPQARFIPDSLWIDEKYFDSSLDEFMVPLMAATKEELPSLLTPNCLAELRLKSKTAWLAIALSHPDLEPKTIQDIAFQLEVNALDLYYLLGILKNKNWFDAFTSAGDIQANYYSAYWLAAEAGSLKDLKILEFKAPGQIGAMIKSKEYASYRLAAENKHLDVLEHLELQAPTLVQAMIQAHEFYAYRLAAAKGHIEILKHLESLVPEEVQQEMIKADGFYAYCLAAQGGHLKVLEHLESKVSPEILEAMIQENSYYAYRLSVLKGLEVAKHLERLAPHRILAMIRASDFYAYRFSAYYGLLENLKHFEVQAPNQIHAMIEASDFYAFRYAFMAQHLEVVQHLFSHSSACFAYAERHGREYASSVNPFIQATLTELHQAALSIPAQEVFDIKDAEQAKICFYILRALIRANERSSDDDLHFLLCVPAVRALAHQEITDDQPNELLRVALESGNEETVALLLMLPEVRRLAEQNNYYQDERQGRLNLAQLARDRESSLTALTQGESNRLQTFIAHYKPQLDAEGVPRLMQALREQLIARYQDKPAFIQDSQGKRLFLPLAFDDFQQLSLQEEDYQRALIAYYQHKNHSAWRYLQKPNPWMNPEADYVIEREAKRWSTFEEYQPFIAMLWLAASDAAVPPVDGYSLEGRINHFFDELAQIGRAHNWDRMRINPQGKEEEYDDLTGDRPSCFSGVKRRLFQSVIGHPLIILLTPDTLLEEVRNFARQHFEDQMQSKALTEVKNALADYITNTADLSEASKKLLASLNIPAQKLLDFELNLTHKYGAQYTADLGLRKYVASRLYLKPDSTVISDHYHALMLDGLIGLSTRFFQDKITEVKEASFFIQKTTQSQATTESPRSGL